MAQSAADAGQTTGPGDAPAPVGVLADGIPYFAPAGAVLTDGDLVMCHLCGSWRRSVTAHLRAHGWTKDAYCAAFGLERGQSLEGAATRKLRAASFTARLLFEPAVLAGSARGRARARAGDLTMDAAAAARGRPLPEQRRRKAHESMAGCRHPGSAQASRERARRHLTSVAATVATDAGYPDLGAFVLARTAQGASLATISREAGLHKDWLSRHLADLDPAAATAARAQQRRAGDARWLTAVAAAGFADVGDYLRDRHVERHWSVNQIAAEADLGYHAVESALARYGLAKVAHAAKRHAARARAAQVAAALGYDSVADYVTERRSAGWSWSAVAAEAGQPQSWLGRQLRKGTASADGELQLRA